MNLRKNIRGNALVIVAVLVVLAAVIGYFFLQRKDGPTGDASASAFEVAKLIPGDSIYASAWQLEGHVDVNSWIKDMREIIQMSEQPDSLKEFEAELGMSTEEFADLFNKTGFMAVLDTVNPEKPSVICSLGLADGAKFATWWEKQSADYPSEFETVDLKGISFRAYPDGPWIGYDKSWLYITDSKETTETLLSTMSGETVNLADKVSFQEAQSQIGNDQSAGFVYLQTEELFTKLQGIPVGDKRMWKELAPVKYMIASADFSQMQLDGFVRIDGESNLANKLTAPGNLSPDFPKLLGSEVSSFMSIDVKWIWDSTLAIMGVFPESRSYAGMAPAALLAYNPFGALTGEIIMANNLDESVTDTLATLSDDSQPDPFKNMGLIIGPVKDLDITHQLIVKAMPEASELTPKDGEDTTYPTPPGLKMVLKGASPQSLMLSNPGADERLLDTSAGKFVDIKLFQQIEKWGGKDVIYRDYMDFEPVFDALVQVAKTEGGEHSEIIQASAERVRAHISSFEGGSALRPAEKGLHWRAYGASNGAVIAGGGIVAAILVPNFIRARAQGQMTACKSNLKNCGTALEMWAVDHSGNYPDSLDKLTPDYLVNIPTCPAAGVNTYSGGYTGGSESYSVHCQGQHHTDLDVPANRPQYNSVDGLVVY